MKKKIRLSVVRVNGTHSDINFPSDLSISESAALTAYEAAIQRTDEFKLVSVDEYEWKNFGAGEEDWSLVRCIQHWVNPKCYNRRAKSK